MSRRDGDIPETDDELYALIDSPKPKVKLVGRDGNAFAIMGACREAWQKAGKSSAKWREIQLDMMSSDYDHLLQIAMKYFKVS